MAKFIHGERVGRMAKLQVGCSVLAWDETHTRILLTRRADNGRWCLPGGAVDPGENVEETAIREMREETGLEVRVTRLIGVYSTPDVIVEYADGNRRQLIALSFEGEVIGGVLGLSDETTEFGYFTPAEIETMDVIDTHPVRIADALANQVTPFIR